MKVYVFGNQDQEEDSLALKVADELKGKIPGLEFVEVKPNEDVPFVGEDDAPDPLLDGTGPGGASQVVIMDVVEGLNELRVLENEDLEKLVMAPRNSVHDWDLGFQIKYLQKLGKLGKVRVIGLPKGKEVVPDQLHSILRKLVAQDMQGS